MTGIVGNETIEKCKVFQASHNLIADGICGPKTRAEISNIGDDWGEIEHFEPSEFACGCGCGYNPIQLRLVRVLEMIRGHFGDYPAIITSGCRCTTYNKKVGGIQGSQHINGGAADFYIKGISIATLLAYCQSLARDGIISYTYTNNTNMSGAVHINL